MQIIQGGRHDPRVMNLLQIHLTTARSNTAPGSAHALDLSGLACPDITFWSAWEDEVVCGVGEVKRLSLDHGEIKSMHVAQSMRRSGIGTAMLHHIIRHARDAGVSRLSLETGSWDYFRPARSFYRRHGFVECQPFADYRPDSNSVFMSLDLLRS
ncbi:MAG: GNAT family N-acetyltransferase [Methylobacteriaceae bacterium]|nr:GNAT family N-acetyltransferase [Methylobacteriaceae bacterium]